MFRKRVRSIIILAVVALFTVAGYLWLMPGDDIMTASLKGDTRRVCALLWRNPKLARTNTYHKYTPLHWAAMDGHLKMAESLIKAGADVNALSQEKVSPLYLAAQKGHVEIVKLLLNNGADPNVAASYSGGQHSRNWCTNSFDGCTPLFVAAENGHAAVVQLLLSHHVDPNKITKYGSPLARAVLEKHEKVVDVLLQTGANPNLRDNDGNTALIYVDSAPVAVKLLRNGADPNITSSRGSVALHSACRGRNPEIVKLLFDYGANPNVKDKNGDTPLHEVLHICGSCGEEGRREIVEILLNKGTAVNVKNNDGETPTRRAELGDRWQLEDILKRHGGRSSGRKSNSMFSATAMGDIQKVSAILNQNPHMVNLRDEKKLTPLHLAAHCRNLDMVKLLVARGANINARSDSLYSPCGDGTPLEGAVVGGNPAIVRFLLEHTVDPKRRAQDVLYVTAELGRDCLMDILVAYGADVKTAKYQGMSLLQVAAGGGVECSEGYKRVISFLLSHGCDIKKDGPGALLRSLGDQDRLDVAKLLVAKGVKVSDVQRQNDDMLHNIAMNPWCPESLEFLLHHGANPNVTNDIGQTALNYAHDPETIHSLLQHGGRLGSGVPKGPSLWQRFSAWFHSLF